MIDKTELIAKGCQFLSLTYEHSAKSLPKAITKVLIMFNCELVFILNHIIVTLEQ